MWKIGKSEDGSLIVEASIVFPTMFLVIFFMIFAGNAYMQKCRVEAIVVDAVIESAARCADPLLKNMEEGNIPSFDGVSLVPYRYMTGGMGDAVSAVESNMSNKLHSMSTGLFDHMKPEIASCNLKFNNSFIYSTVSADVTYKIMVPVRLLGENDFMHMKFATHVETSVSDVPEFMRNVDMVEDIVQRLTGDDFNGTIQNVVEKVRNLFPTSGS